MKNDISVIIPCYNRVTRLGRAIDSVLSQTIQAGEVIVVDDGSSDTSADFVSTTYPDVILIRQEHAGVSSARNHGMKAARGKWYAFLDSDDEWLPDKLKKQHALLARHPEYRIIHSNEIWIRNGRPLAQLAKHRKYGGWIFKRCLPLCVISPSSVMLHRDIIKHVGGFDESMPVCEDYDMWLRVCARYPVLFLDEELIVKYGGHDDQLSHRYCGMDVFRVQAINRILEEGILDNREHMVAVSEMLKKIDIYLKGAEKHGNSHCVREFRALREKYSTHRRQDRVASGPVPG